MKKDQTSLDGLVNKLFEDREALTLEETCTLAHLATLWRGRAISFANDLCLAASPEQCAHVIDVLEDKVRVDSSAGRANQVIRRIRGRIQKQPGQGDQE